LAKSRPRLQSIGWREWVALPELGVAAIKAKIDTGARSCALHASRFEEFEVDGRPMLRFDVHPFQRDSGSTVRAEAPIVERRSFRSSSGHEQRRWVVTTSLSLNGEHWPIELSLTTRDEMGFRLLIGRQALRRRFLVDSGRSYLCGVPEEAALHKRRSRK